MLFDITHRYSNKPIFTADIDCEEDAPRSWKLRLAALWGIKNKADLSEADLREADLRGANLNEAYLSEAVGGNKYVKSAQIGQYSVVYTSTHLWIGCKGNTIDWWMGAKEDDFGNPKHWEQWKENKSFIKQMIKKYPALPTKED